ncbi:MAG: hypothetical protein IPK57_15500 [Chitinophagaceae bacterium]|nr:hypothetical protein [Chitinophagaceae bacterium]
MKQKMAPALRRILCFRTLKLQMAEPVILIHRGHSYHLSHTLRRLQQSVKLAIRDLLVVVIIVC